MRQCKKNNDYCSIFEEDTALNVRVGLFAKITVLPLGSCTCLCPMLHLYCCLELMLS